MIDIECPVCGARFEVRDSLKGGAVNCRQCSEVLEVPGSDVTDQLFYAAVVAGAVAVLVTGGILIARGAVTEGLIVIGVGAVVGGGVYVGM